MTTPPAPGTGSLLDFNAPLSEERARHLVAELAKRAPATITDFGCGWGELLLRLLEAVPGATGLGIERHEPDLDRARRNAVARGLEGRASFTAGDAAGHDTPSDLVLSVGAYQAFGTIPEALAVLRKLVAPGGRLLFAAEFWERVPDEERLARMWPGTTAADCVELPELVDQAVAAGFRPLRVERATRGEWEAFESCFTAELEEWLLDNPGHAQADEVRAKADELRALWLRGHRDVMGFAYLILGVPR
ncbi:SAM-dependent methyltransferase [Nonomuraea soli]|uniref:SAM-dependent methyltransferase n=1 Tax=Nonomuraea soli TaxID=1032476 RepID=A0A7W0CG69_9ACTN|nr:class I SAM-dependent methyltransferase [Nonomuraea soli]MBA2890608.1 SAM-dependent methyltransferase [Nonomuraea soli]